MIANEINPCCAGGRVHLRAGQDQRRYSLTNIQAAFESVNLDR